MKEYLYMKYRFIATVHFIKLDSIKNKEFKLFNGACTSKRRHFLRCGVFLIDYNQLPNKNEEFFRFIVNIRYIIGINYLLYTKIKLKLWLVFTNSSYFKTYLSH